MFEIKWKDTYLVGDTLIDQEHERLFEIAAEAQHVIDPTQRKQKIRDIVHAIYAYSKTHFEHEEAYMASIGYPGLKTHKQEHEHIIGLMSHFIRKLPSMSTQEFEKELAYFIQTLMVGHIILKDRKIAIWLANNGEKVHDIAFKDAYLIGNEVIDAEHQQLFAIATKFFEPHDNRGNQIRAVKKAAAELSHYMQEHFEHEEEYMHSIDYQYLTEHQALHQKIIFDFNTIIKSISTLDIDAVERELALFIEINLIEHIMLEDKKITAYQDEIIDISNL